MKKSPIVFLQIVVGLIGLGAMALMLWEPQLEGRNVNASLFEIYFKDPFLAYMYIGSIAFYVAIYQAFRLLGYIRQNELFSQRSVNTLRKIKYCAMIVIGFILGAEAYFFIAVRGKDDIAGGVILGLLLMFVFIVIATVAAVFEKALQNAVDLKTENDLTI